MLAVLAIAEVALGGQDRFRNRDNLFRPTEADHVAESWIGDLLAVGHPHAAASSHVEPEQLVFLGDGDKPEVVGEYVDVVAGRHCDGDLEFAGQVVLAVHRLFVGGQFAAG